MVSAASLRLTMQGNCLSAMSNVDTRQVNRDSLLLLAQLRVDGQDRLHQIKVRNLSAGGMMAEGDVRVTRGSLIAVELRNIGWVEGSVAWKQDNRFGIAFVEEVDPKLARAPLVGDDFESPRYTRASAMGMSVDASRLRKI